MNHVCVLLAFAACSLSTPALANKTPCPANKAGASYPWQNLTPTKGDHYAVVLISVDRTGRPLKCGVGANNIPDPDVRFLLCAAFKGDWRGPPAKPGDPDIRTLTRPTTMIGYEHKMADEKARRQWFKDHPGERQECYPD